jgi:hypothetical protein
MTGYYVPELIAFTRPLLYDNFEQRPTALAVLKAFDALASTFTEKRLNTPCPVAP